MANVFTGHQFNITTPFTSPLAPMYVKIKDGNWQGMLAAATLTIQDLSGMVLSYTAYQANYPIGLGGIGWLKNFTVPTLSSGTLNLFVDK